jgi:hypothetical protein
MDVWQRVIDLEARMITLQKRVADTYQKTPVMISTDPVHTDYKTYDGPFMMGFPSGGSVRVGPGYVLAPGGGYAWTGGTGSLAYAGANFVTLDLTMDGDTVESAEIGCYSTLDDVTSTPTLRKVLIGVAQRSGNKVVGRTQEQRGNIYLGGVTLDSAVMYAEPSALGSLAQLDMTTEHETDTAVIECTEATPSHITVKEDGIYHIDLYAELSIVLNGIESIVPQASVFVYADGAETSTTRKFRRRLEGGGVALAGSPDGSIVEYSSSGGNIYLTADTVLSVWTYGTPSLSACSYVAISVHLVRPYTEPEP